MRVSNAFVTRFMEEYRILRDKLENNERSAAAGGMSKVFIEEFLTEVRRDQTLREGFELALTPEAQEIHAPDIT